jgi:hypothetical protein
MGQPGVFNQPIVYLSEVVFAPDNVNDHSCKGKKTAAPVERRRRHAANTKTTV